MSVWHWQYKVFRLWPSNRKLLYLETRQPSCLLMHFCHGLSVVSYGLPTYLDDPSNAKPLVIELSVTHYLHYQTPPCQHVSPVLTAIHITPEQHINPDPDGSNAVGLTVKTYTFMSHYRSIL
jgi:hypothetical protein